MDILIILLLLFLILAIILQDIFNFPTYNRLAIPLPQPPGLTNLPPFLFFDIDTRFTSQEVDRIKLIISSTLLNWSFHYTQKWNGGLNNGVSALEICCNMYAFNRLQPIWYKGTPIVNGIQAADLAIDVLTQRFKENGLNGEIAKINYRVPFNPTNSTIRGKTAFRKNNVSLSVTINPLRLDDLGIADVSLVGSLVHAWLHRCGYNHPLNLYTTYLIGELPMCIMRGYAPKNPSTPDSVYTQYFD